MPSQVRKFTGGEVVQCQIGDDRGVLGIPGKAPNVGPMPIRPARPVRRARAKVQAVHREASPQERHPHLARARAELKDPFPGAQMTSQHLPKPPLVAQHPVDDSKIPPAAPRRRVVRRKRVKNLRLKNSVHVGEQWEAAVFDPSVAFDDNRPLLGHNRNRKSCRYQRWADFTPADRKAMGQDPAAGLPRNGSTRRR